MSKVALRDCHSGEIVVHAEGSGGGAGYATLCGCSDNDDMMDRVPTPRGALIDCNGCKTIFEEARRFRPKDFA